MRRDPWLRDPSHPPIRPRRRRARPVGRCRPLGGTIVSARQLADAYGITDTDGSKPDCWGYLAAYGWEREDGAGIDDFR